MPGTDVGTEKPKYGSVRYDAFFSEPSSAAVTSARVALIGMRRPTPYLPPVQPVVDEELPAVVRGTSIQCSRLVLLQASRPVLTHRLHQRRCETPLPAEELRPEASPATLVVSVDFAQASHAGRRHCRAALKAQ